MKRKLFLYLFSMTLLFASVCFSQKRELSEIRRIDRYVRHLTAYVEKPSIKLEIYGDVSTSKKPKWRKFLSAKSLEKFRESHDVYEIAFVWRKSGKIVVVNFTFTSGSGDWAHYVFHRFRPDGTLANVEADLRTFYGHVSVERCFYFRPNGELITRQTKFRDIATGEPKKPGDDFYDNKVRIYKSTNRLPFMLK